MKREKEIKKFVKDRYAKIASEEDGYATIASKEGSCCPSCASPTDLIEQAKSMGYSEQEIKSVPKAAMMGLGCGNPTALAELRKGEAVLDLGSGGGLDVSLAAQKVGEKGKVIGVDMTSEMVEKARGNAKKDIVDTSEWYIFTP
jgi:2-polyprenyl-3-methyl-5-hydroxy-6-metoxy-1,4-benzoquinol methylase